MSRMLVLSEKLSSRAFIALVIRALFEFPVMLVRIKKAVMRATTDNVGAIHYDPENQPGITNLINIYSAFTGRDVQEIAAAYQGQGYGSFKKDLVEILTDSLTPVREKYEEIRHSDELKGILKDGAAKADAIARKTMERVRKNFGLGIL